MISTRLLAALALSLTLAACTNDSSTTQGVGDDDDDGGSGIYELTTGTYQYTITEAPADTCWAPPKTNPVLPTDVVADVVANGTSIQITPNIANIPPQTYTVTKSGNALDGAADGDADLNSQGIDCILHMQSTFTGNMTAKDTFDAEQVINISEAGGTMCGLLVGTFSPDQVDQLPCSITLKGPTVIQP